MPILPAEPDLFPNDLLDAPESVDSSWWLLYVKSRQEKAVTRHLRENDLPHYSPLIRQRYRSPNGRMRESYVPLFSTYVFLRGGDEERYRAVCGGRVMQASPIIRVAELLDDLRQIRDLIAMDVPLSIEARLEPGERVRVRNGPFKGYEGTIIRRENETRLLVFVRFMEQGVSVKVEDCQVEPIG